MGSFLVNCLQLEDIVIEDSGRERDDFTTFFPMGNRIIALDEVCASLRPRPKVSILVGNTFYNT